MKNFKIIKRIEKEIILLKVKKFKDKRGIFKKIFSFEELNKFLNKNKIQQINYVQNKKKGIIRGLHYQIGKYAEQKLIICTKGEIQNTILQMDKKRKNYLKVYKFILSDKNNYLLIVPKYYANGYQVLKNNSEVMYCSNNKYNQSFERLINPNDPKIKITWKIKNQIKSKKDKFSKFIK